MHNYMLHITFSYQNKFIFVKNGNPENHHFLGGKGWKQAFNFERLQTLTKLSDANKFHNLSNVRPSTTTFITGNFFYKVFKGNEEEIKNYIL